MREDIIKYLHDEVKRRCELSTNHFGMGCYYHIKSVVKNAEILAKKYDANIEIVIIASWLHDIASVTDYSLYEEHHIYGAKMAYEILQQFKYEEDKIEAIQNCILNHRGSIDNKRLTIEELCVADADAISHFDNLPSLLYLAYVKKGMEIDKGRIFVKNKLIRSYEKLSFTSKELYQNKYSQLIEILSL